MPRLLLMAVLVCCSLQAYASDSLVCTGKFNKQGLKHGTWACRKDNRVVRSEKYKHGVLVSYILFNEKGQVIETRDKKGKVRKYDPCGC